MADCRIKEIHYNDAFTPSYDQVITEKYERKDGPPGWEEAMRENQHHQIQADESSDDRSESDASATGRGQWSNRFEFAITMLGSAVGLGNMWRFPFLAYRNGGGAFLIPFLLMTITIGMPIFFLESALGQFASLGAIEIWRVNPLMHGLGYAMILTLWFIALYYNITLTHCFVYLIASFFPTLPWDSCENYWNTENCLKSNVNITNTSTTPAEEFYNNYVLNKSPSIDEFGTPQPHLVVCLLIDWAIIICILLFGAKSLGKAAYFTSLFPYVMLITLLITSCLQEGAMTGIIYFFEPKFERLLTASVWADAASQVFYSISSCNGALLAMSSYNNYKNNIVRDAIFVVGADMITSIICGATVFSALGFIANSKGVPIDSVLEEGPGLVFVVYPEILLALPVPQLFSILFFLMMCTLGLGSTFADMEGVLVALSDWARKLLGNSTRRRIIFRITICLCTMLLALPMTCNGGIYLLDLIDSSIGTFPMIFIAIFEIVAIQFMYGYRRFTKDIEIMTGYKPNIYWIICWTIVVPVVLVLILIVSFIQYRTDYTSWTLALSWIITLLPIVQVPFWALYYFCIPMKAWVILKESWKPMKNWGPALKDNYREHRELMPKKYQKFQSPESTAAMYAKYLNNNKIRDSEIETRVSTSF